MILNGEGVLLIKSHCQVKYYAAKATLLFLNELEAKKKTQTYLDKFGYIRDAEIINATLSFLFDIYKLVYFQ